MPEPNKTLGAQSTIEGNPLAGLPIIPGEIDGSGGTSGQVLQTDGTVAGVSWASVSGGSGTTTTTTTTTTSVTAGNNENVLADASGGAITVTLPAPDVNLNVTIKKIDGSANGVTIATPGTETIDGQASVTVTSQYIARTLTSDGTNYFII